jgi:2-dehydro-3-deoxyphosphogluconate aldolase/(4S)-4-hydroxy-2-oxoglutarate aldolase
MRCAASPEHPDARRMSSPQSNAGARSPQEVADRLASMRVIPVLRLPSRQRATEAIDCLIEAGYRTVELTLTTPDAIGLLAELRRGTADEFLVGAGTVLDLDSAAACLDAGADYLVSPCLVPGMARLAAERGCAALMGGFTPGEVLAAWREGAQIVKLFPAATGGPGHLAAIHAIYPDIPLCPTGGVSQANVLDWFIAGARVVGVGNNVIDQKALAAGDRAQVTRHARAFLELAASVAIDRPQP